MESYSLCVTIDSFKLTKRAIEAIFIEIGKGKGEKEGKAVIGKCEFLTLRAVALKSFSCVRDCMTQIGNDKR